MKNHQSVSFLVMLLAVANCAGRISSETNGPLSKNPGVSRETSPPSAGEEFGTFIGIVKKGEVQILRPGPPSPLTARLTKIGMPEARTPESAEIDLSSYEGLVLMIQGANGGGWIYEARIVDKGGPLLTQIVKDLYIQNE